LPKVADKAATAVMVMHVGPQQARHPRRQLFGMLRPDQQVEMVGHQAVVVESHGEALPVALYQVEEVGGILLGTEHDLAIVPAIHHVVVDARRPAAAGAVCGA
jgi:hypothetical protein